MLVVSVLGISREFVDEIALTQTPRNDELINLRLFDLKTL
jgi:hypothetical protein